MNYSIIIFLSLLLLVQSLKPKFCVKCKYFIPDNDSNEFAKCALFPKTEGKIDYLVSGIHTDKYYYCSTTRELNNMCGEEGKYYKRKRVKKPDSFFQ